MIWTRNNKRFHQTLFYHICKNNIMSILYRFIINAYSLSLSQIYTHCFFLTLFFTFIHSIKTNADCHSITSVDTYMSNEVSTLIIFIILTWNLLKDKKETVQYLDSNLSIPIGVIKLLRKVVDYTGTCLLFVFHYHRHDQNI